MLHGEMVLVDDYMKTGTGATPSPAANSYVKSGVTVVSTGSPDKNLVLSNEEIKEEEHEDDQAGSTPEQVNEVTKFEDYDK